MALLALGACASPSSESWRGCEDAFAQLSPPRAPTEHASILPIEVGDTLPTLRMTGQALDAEALANRALASACVLTDGEVAARPELLRWAEAVLDGERFPDVGDVFDPPLFLQSSPSGTVALDVAVTRESDAAQPDPAPGTVDVGVGPASAQVIAETALAQLVERGLLADTEQGLSHASQLREGQCDAVTDLCREYVERYSFVFESQVAGVAVIGSWALIDVDREGTLVGVRSSSVDVESGGTSVAVIDEMQAAQRFLELARAEFPTHEVEIHTPGQVAFIVPRADEPTEVEAVWYGSWIAASDGVIGPPQSSSLSLGDANAPLVPHGP